MKRLFALLTVLAFLSGCAAMDLTKTEGDLRARHFEGSEISVTQYLTLTANAANQPLDPRLAGAYLYQVEADATNDDAFTLVIKSHLGNTLFSGTWASATTDEEPKQPTGLYVIPEATVPTYTLTDFSGVGSVTFEITSVKK